MGNIFSFLVDVSYTVVVLAVAVVFALLDVVGGVLVIVVRAGDGVICSFHPY